MLEHKVFVTYRDNDSGQQKTEIYTKHTPENWLLVRSRFEGIVTYTHAKLVLTFSYIDERYPKIFHTKRIINIHAPGDIDKIHISGCQIYPPSQDEMF